jgi:hypothetical protein
VQEKQNTIPIILQTNPATAIPPGSPVSLSSFLPIVLRIRPTIAATRPKAATVAAVE